MAVHFFKCVQYLFRLLIIVTLSNTRNTKQIDVMLLKIRNSKSAMESTLTCNQQNYISKQVQKHRKVIG